MKMWIIGMPLMLMSVLFIFCLFAGVTKFERIPVQWQFDASLIKSDDSVAKQIEILVPVDNSGMLELRAVVEKVAQRFDIKPQSCLLFFKSLTGAVTPLCSWFNKNPRYISRCFGKRITLSRLQKGGTLLVRLLEMPRYGSVEID